MGRLRPPSGACRHNLGNHWGRRCNKETSRCLLGVNISPLCSDGIFLPQFRQVRLSQLLNYLPPTYVPFAGRLQVSQYSTPGEKLSLPYISLCPECPPLDREYRRELFPTSGHEAVDAFERFMVLFLFIGRE